MDFREGQSPSLRRLRIGVDIDGVIVDCVTAWLPLLSELCGRPVLYQDIITVVELGAVKPLVGELFTGTLFSTVSEKPFVS